MLGEASLHVCLFFIHSIFARNVPVCVENALSISCVLAIELVNESDISYSKTFSHSNNLDW